MNEYLEKELKNTISELSKKYLDFCYKEECEYCAIDDELCGFLEHVSQINDRTVEGD